MLDVYRTINVVCLRIVKTEFVSIRVKTETHVIRLPNVALKTIVPFVHAHQDS